MRPRRQRRPVLNDRALSLRFSSSRTLIALAIVALAAPAAALSSRSPSLEFSFLPARVTQGRIASAAVSVRPAGLRCTLEVRYVDGYQQERLKAARAVRGRAAWKWRVPATAAPGPAQVTVSCAGAGRLSRALAVLEGPGAPTAITVEKQGFSQRSESPGGLTVSYGVVLASPATDKDALGVDVLVNLVDAANVVQNSTTTRISAIAAGSTYFLGGFSSVGVPIVRLEVVAKAQSSQPKSLHLPPIDDVRISQGSFDSGFVGAVAGQVLNDHPSMLIAGSKLSVVVFDAGGNVVGGGSGFVMGPLYPGARIYFSASAGFRAIPYPLAAGAQVSIEPNYQPVP